MFKQHKEKQEKFRATHEAIIQILKESNSWYFYNKEELISACYFCHQFSYFIKILKHS